MSKKQNSKKKEVIDLTNFIKSDMTEPDENGSYTGVTKNKGEKPVQDADDL